MFAPELISLLAILTENWCMTVDVTHRIYKITKDLIRVCAEFRHWFN